MATHSSILASKAAWTEEAGRLQSMESQRVGYDWITENRLWKGVTDREKFFNAITCLVYLRHKKKDTILNITCFFRVVWSLNYIFQK